MIRIGSRGSALARWQAEHIAAKLRDLGEDVSIEILVTTGDRVQQAPFMQVGTKGMFTKEIEEALAEERIDLAVHSLKDLPTELEGTFVLAAIPERADPRDAFVSVSHESFSTLPLGAVVGTSSLRRQAFLRMLRPDLVVRELRGNVDTRLRKLQEGQYDAIVLAAAGLDRLQQTQWARERFAPQMMCPAAGQGALGIECRAKDDATQMVVAALDHAPTRFAVTAGAPLWPRWKAAVMFPSEYIVRGWSEAGTSRQLLRIRMVHRCFANSYSSGERVTTWPMRRMQAGGLRIVFWSAGRETF